MCAEQYSTAYINIHTYTQTYTYIHTHETHRGTYLFIHQVVFNYGNSKYKHYKHLYIGVYMAWALIYPSYYLRVGFCGY